MFAIGMAYRGTDNNGAIQKLLHFAVSDVSDDVRRAAVINLGFVLLGVPDQCPAIVSLLAQSYNPHLRYGAAIAVGIACAGSGNFIRSFPPGMYSFSWCRHPGLFIAEPVFARSPRSDLLAKFKTCSNLAKC
jgi:hypothetical protein